MAADDFLDGTAQEPGGGGIGLQDDSRLRVGHQDGVAALVEEGVVFLFALAQAVFDALPFGHVQDRAQELDDAAAGVPLGLSPGHDRPRRAVGVQNPKLHLVGDAFAHGPLDGRRRKGLVVGMDPGRPLRRGRGLGGRRQAVDAEHLRRPERFSGGRIERPAPHVGHSLGLGQLAFLAPGLVLRPLAQGDIAQGGHQGRLPVPDARRCDDLDQGGRTRGPGDLDFGDPLAGQGEAQSHSGQVLRGTPEQLGGGGIGVEEGPLPVGDDDAVGGLVHQRPEVVAHQTSSATMRWIFFLPALRIIPAGPRSAVVKSRSRDAIRSSLT